MTSPIDAAYRLMEEALITYRGDPVGTVAARDADAPSENYSECFIRDFVPCAMVFLLDGRTQIVRDFLYQVMVLRDQQETMEGHQQLPGVMPASFRVNHSAAGETLHADFGDRAIGRVAPVDSMMWWLLLLRAYTRLSGDRTLVESPDCQRAIRLIMTLSLRDRYEVFPTLLVPDGSFMIDRRMGVYGHPLEIQSLFFGALHCAQELLLDDEENRQIIAMSHKREQTLRAYIRIYYWLDLERLNEIHRFKTEEFGHDSRNVLNIYPESIPDWILDWLPDGGGYLVGNLGPGRMDFRFFAFGNLLAILFDLSTDEQAASTLHLYEQRWDDLIGTMPAKICYPAMEGVEWQLMTGSDPKNSPWSYHNGGNWPALLWAFVGAAVKSGRSDLAERALAVATPRLYADNWPEYYDGRNGRLIGRQANHRQTWSAAALILGQKLIESPRLCSLFGFHDCAKGGRDPHGGSPAQPLSKQGGA